MRHIEHHAPRILTALAFVGAGLTTACGDGGGLIDRPTPPMTAREALAPGGAGLGWMPGSSSDAGWTIGPQGIGPLVVGMSSEGFVAAGQSVTLMDDRDVCTPVRPDGAPDGVVAWTENGQVVAAVVSEPGPRLVSGLGVGSAESDLRRQYGARLQSVDDEPGWLVVDPPPTLAGHRVAFELRDGVIARIRVGPARSQAGCH